MANIILSNYYIIGTERDKPLRDQLCNIVRRIGITLGWSFSSSSHYYFYSSVNNRFDRVPSISALGVIIEQTKQCVSISDFITICNTYLEELKSRDWFRQLEPGMKVTIDTRLGEIYDYPFGYGDKMAALAGKEFTIVKIEYGRIIGNSDVTKRRMFNGDYNGYRILESPGSAFVWHSSMFIPLGVTPIKKLKLNDVLVLSKIL